MIDIPKLFDALAQVAMASGRDVSPITIWLGITNNFDVPDAIGKQLIEHWRTVRHEYPFHFPY